MTETGDGIYRPILIGATGVRQRFKPPRGGSSKVKLPSPSRQGQRLDEKFDRLERALEDQVSLATSLDAADPELVVVFEAIDSRVDLAVVARSFGFEVIGEAEGQVAPSEDFPRLSTRKSGDPVSLTLHAICLNRRSVESLLMLWRRWKPAGTLLRGESPMRDLFAHMQDVRTWSPSDRLAEVDWEAFLSESLDGITYGVELELWYRKNEILRSKAERSVTAMVNAAGGRVLKSAQVADVGYHGMRCNLPADLVRAFAQGSTDDVELVRSSHLRFLRVSPQCRAGPEPDVASVDIVQDNLPSGEPVLCLLDGIPVVNHPRLAGRVVINDPDDLIGTSRDRASAWVHGTHMASIAVWGDLGSRQDALDTRVLVRPILEPSLSDRDHNEELRPEELAPDLMVRVFRELFDGQHETRPAAPSVVVLNLSVGDRSAPFDTTISAWARTIDWLSWEYGVLVVVSAGNHGDVPTNDAAGVNELVGVERGTAVSAAVHSVSGLRRLLAPAEAINALTVGALHADAAEPGPFGYLYDPADGHMMVSPASALGPGYRRSVKPDLIAPGGRVLFKEPLVGLPQDSLNIALPTIRGPGIRVAHSDGTSESYTVGTSAAAAFTSHRAAQVVDLIKQLVGPSANSRHQLAVGAKALLLHGTRAADDLLTPEKQELRARGYGVQARDFRLGCGANEAVMLFFGQLGASEMCDLLLPLPDGLQVRGVKRISATLAWLSPINWRHRDYRRAALEFTTPAGFTPLGGPQDSPVTDSKRGTAQHLVWEVNKAVPVGVGDSIRVNVKCAERAGGLDGVSIPFAAAVSLWVAPELEIDVYTQVRAQVEARVRVVP